MAESRGLLKVLSRPRVVTQNNIQALVKQGVRVPIVTQAQLGGPPTVTYVDAFLRLTVTPQITSENTIFLNVDVENTTPNFGQEVQGNPELITQQATTQVLVTDGGTVVIGGVIQTQNSINITQVPLLGNIPVLGNLFKHTQVQYLEPGVDLLHHAANYSDIAALAASKIQAAGLKNLSGPAVLFLRELSVLSKNLSTVPASALPVKLSGNGFFLARQKKLREHLATTRFDAFLISHLPNIRYLCGFTGSAGLLLVEESGSVFFTDVRYDTQAHEEVKGAKVVIARKALLSAVAEWIWIAGGAARRDGQSALKPNT